MATHPDAKRKDVLEQIARRTMQAFGFLPDFSADALAALVTGSRCSWSERMYRRGISISRKPDNICEYCQHLCGVSGDDDPAPLRVGYPVSYALTTIIVLILNDLTMILS